jgi:hypothetical protein
MAESSTASPSGTDQKESSYYKPPAAVELPKGGGAIRGIGEKFSVNPVTGTGSLSLPIATTPGRSGFSPQLSLSYDSGGAMEPLAWAGICQCRRFRGRRIRACPGILMGKIRMSLFCRGRGSGAGPDLGGSDWVTG